MKRIHARILADAITHAPHEARPDEIRLFVKALYARIEVLEQTCEQQATALVELERRLAAVEPW